MHEIRERFDVRELCLWCWRKRSRYRVHGDSMLPLFRSGEEILVNHQAYRKKTPQIGDIVIAKHPYITGETILKRISSFEDNGNIVVIGENATESTDSRAFGAITPDSILGQVTGRFL